jgi:hypothetical protein
MSSLPEAHAKQPKPTGEDTPADGHIASEGALLVDVVTCMGSKEVQSDHATVCKRSKVTVLISCYQ